MLCLHVIRAIPFRGHDRCAAARADLVNVFEQFLPQLLRYPNPSDPLNGEAAALLLREPEKYNERVREYVKRFASPAGSKAAAETPPKGRAAAGVAARSPSEDSVGSTMSIASAASAASSYSAASVESGGAGGAGAGAGSDSDMGRSSSSASASASASDSGRSSERGEGADGDEDDDDADSVVSDLSELSAD